MSDNERIVSMAQTNNCDVASAMREVLDLLVDANMHEDDDESDDEVYGRVQAAKAKLFCIATEWKKAKR